MERLTFEGNFCDIAQCRALPCPYDNNCMQKQVWERLRDYEDAGITPEAAAHARQIEDGLNEDGYSTARMVEVMKADKDGRVVVLPCKVGDAYYTIEKFCTEDGHFSQKVLNTIIDCECCSVDSCDAEMRIVTHQFSSKRTILNYTRQIGKTVFLTREEAEKALEAKKDG